MTYFLANLLLALVWAALTNDFSLSNLLLGFAFGFVVLFAAQRAALPAAAGYFTRIPRVIAFMLFYMRELVLANVRVAIDVVTPRHRTRPGIVAVPLDAQTDAEITVLANLISMTPGSLSVDVSDDKRVLYVHEMFAMDPAEVRARIKDDFERRVLEMLR